MPDTTGKDHIYKILELGDLAPGKWRELPLDMFD